MISISSKHKNLDKIDSSIGSFSKEFRFNEVARKSNFLRNKGFGFSVLFCYLMMSIFSKKSLFRDYQMNKESKEFSEKTVRNLLNNPKMNWQRFLVLIAKQVIDKIEPLTSKDRKSVFIVDDSMNERLNGKKIELTALQYDHAKSAYKRGYRLLQLGWSDVNTFLPVGTSLLSGSRETVEIQSNDLRSLSGKRKQQAKRKGTQVFLELLSAALKDGIKASYVLFDTWFSSPQMFHEIRKLGLHSVSMIKKSTKVHYRFQEEDLDVKEIYTRSKKRRGRSRYLLSVEVEAIRDGKSIPIKLVYIRNRNKRKDYLVLASTDISLTEDEIIQLYSKRWAIEIYFKMCKQYLRLEKYQGLSYDGNLAHCVLVSICYILLAYKKRQEDDPRTIGALFYEMVEELSETTFQEALFELFALFNDLLKNENILTDILIENQLEEIIQKLPTEFRNTLKQVA